MITRLALWVLDELLPRTRFAHALEVYMSLTDAALVELDEATNEVAAELEAALASGSVTDAATASRITAAAARLRNLAADPENPVPPSEDTPAGTDPGATPADPE